MDGGVFVVAASVRGPFMPRWSQECWTNAFTDKVTDRVKVSETLSMFSGLVRYSLFDSLFAAGGPNDELLQRP